MDSKDASLLSLEEVVKVMELNDIIHPIEVVRRWIRNTDKAKKGKGKQPLRLLSATKASGKWWIEKGEVERFISDYFVDKSEDYSKNLMVENKHKAIISNLFSNKETLCALFEREVYHYGKWYFYRRNITIKEILQLKEKLWIPLYHRRLVWSIQKQRKFIEDYFYEEESISMIFIAQIGKKYVLVDGYQRIMTLYKFCNDKLKIRLRSENDENPSYMGQRLLTFSDFGEEVQKCFFDMAIVSLTEGRNIKDKSALLHAYLAYNYHGEYRGWKKKERKHSIDERSNEFGRIVSKQLNSGIALKEASYLNLLEIAEKTKWEFIRL